MKALYKVLLFCLLCSSQLTVAKSIDSLVLNYDEIENDLGAQQVRYIINQNFLRIDDGSAQADFILFDVKKMLIYSVNHADKTILKIKHVNWQQPNLGFKVSVDMSILKDAPKIDEQLVYQYRVLVEDDVCTKVYFIKDLYPLEMKIQRQYQQVLSGQQVKTLNNTPKEFHTPCFLVDQIYHSGDYFLQGMPVHIVYSRGYEKYLKSYAREGFDVQLFDLPVGYSEYFPFSNE